MLPLIEKKRKWNSFFLKGIKIWVIGDIAETKVRKFFETVIYYKKVKNINILTKEINKFTGNFALICNINKSESFAFVDRIKSFPIYIGSLNKELVFSNFSPLILKSLKKKHLVR